MKLHPETDKWNVRAKTLLSHNQGFSLIELMIVTALIGLMLAIAGPELGKQMATYRLHGATRKLAWELMMARMEAIKRNHNVIVVFLNNHEYTIGADVNHNNVLDGGEGETTDIQASYDNVRFTSATNFTFTPKGMANNVATITVANANGSKDVSVTIAGMVKMH